MSFSFNGVTWYTYDEKFRLAAIRSYNINPGPDTAVIPAGLAGIWMVEATISAFGGPSSGGDPRAGIWLSQSGQNRIFGIGERNGASRGFWQGNSVIGSAGLTTAVFRVQQDSLPEFWIYRSTDGGSTWSGWPGFPTPADNPNTGTGLEHFSAVWGTPNFSASISDLILYTADSSLEGPTLLTPADTAVDQPHILTLTWLAPNPTSRLVISTNTDLSSPTVDSTGITGGSETWPLAFETTYYWGVQKESTGGWSEIWSFTTEAVQKVDHLMTMGLH